LSRAVLDESDAEIAIALNVSPDAIKKIWLRIHQRAAIAPKLAEPALEVARQGTSPPAYHLEKVHPFRRRLPPR
jgi:hypothetical protein